MVEQTVILIILVCLDGFKHLRVNENPFFIDIFFHEKTSLFTDNFTCE